MLTIVTDDERIACAQAELSNKLRIALNEIIPCMVSGAGGGYPEDVAYSAEFNLWYAYRAEEKKHWNGFGIESPEKGRKVSIASEINFPLGGINRSVSGAFAEDEEGNLVILHRGKIRDGKVAFFRFFNGIKVEALDGGKTDHFALVTYLNRPETIANIADFVRQVIAVKKAVKQHAVLNK